MTGSPRFPPPLFGVGILCLFALTLLLFRGAPAASGVENEEAAYWWDRALARSPRNPAPAVIVSRYGFERLRLLRSWRDTAVLREYVEWADRPEAAGLRSNSVVADVSSNDLILLRWPAPLVRADVPVYRDPLGYAVLDPKGGPGRVEIRVRRLPGLWRMPLLRSGMPDQPVPDIHAVLLVAPGVVTIFGGGFSPGPVQVLTREGAAETLYVSPGQINARIPGGHEVAVDVGGMLSEWVAVEGGHPLAGAANGNGDDGP